MMERVPTFLYHYFLDEAGDTTFYGKRMVPILGEQGVSSCFILGLLKVNQPLNDVRAKVIQLQTEIVSDPYYKDIFSIHKKRSYPYHLHAKDDIPEIRKATFELIKSIDCSFEAVVARKIHYIFEKKHNNKDADFYADLLSHLLKKRIGRYDRIVLNIAERHRCTTQNNLQKGLDKALNNPRTRNLAQKAHCKVVFNVQRPSNEPLLSIADYFCWSIQRVFEKGELRFYNYISDKISVICDLYDFASLGTGESYYSKDRKLTTHNCINEKSPVMH